MQLLCVTSISTAKLSSKETMSLCKETFVQSYMQPLEHATLHGFRYIILPVLFVIRHVLFFSSEER